nr:hypothetical protein [Treponema sp.]
MKKSIVLLSVLALGFAANAQVYERTPREYDFELSDIARRITPVLSFNRDMHADGWIWKEGRSSALVEKGKSADFYEINKIDDLNMDIGEDDTSTAWVEGAEGDGIGEWVIVPVKPTGESTWNRLSGSRKHRYDGDFTVSLSVCNGYQKSLDLYRKNNRVREAKISVYAAAMSFGQDDAYLLWNPDCVYEETITLNDDIIKNPICLNYHTEDFSITLPEKYRTEHCELYLKLEIRSVYKGTKYSDTCISEMRATVDAAGER